MSSFDKQLEEELEKLKKKKQTLTPLQNALTGGRYSYLPTNDIAPVLQNTVKKITEQELAPIKQTVGKSDEERTWFQSGAMDDDLPWYERIGKTSISSAQDTFDNLLAGVIDIGEKAVDAGAYVVGGVGKIFGADEFADDMEKFIKKDLYDAKAVAKKLTSTSTLNFLGADVENDSILGEKSESLVQSAGQLGATAGLQMVGVPWFVTTGVTSFGGEVEGAFKNNATYGEAGLSAAISAGAEILTEKISGGIKFGGKALDDTLTKQIAKGISNKTVRTLAKLGLDMTGEGAEEVLSGVMSAIGQKITYADDKELTELFSSEDALESFIGGAVLGGGMGGINAVKSKVNGVDYTSGKTANEEAVVKKEVENRIAEQEKNGKKLTNKEKAAIEDQVEKDLEKGYISTDTIESVLGDRSAYDSLVKESEEFNTLYDSANLSKRQQDRLAELEAKNKANPYETALKDAKSKHSDSVLNLVKSENKGRGSRLLESYNERARMAEDFKADLTKYEGSKHKEAAKKTIESAIKAGANNTNRVHDLVDMAAQISADTGRTFYFKSGEQIKNDFIERQTKVVSEIESIPEAERTAEQNQKLTDLKDLIAKVESGETKVNGDITEDGITLNLDSTKPLNRTVGHEVTHSLEKAKSYNELKESLFAYAKSKGIDIDSELKSRKLMYEGITNANPEAELVSDLVGDFLFTDSEYIKKLSTENRNVFQKIWDEVKYLYSVATAGSKEARELAQVKKAFEDAYRESVVNNGENTKYSLEKRNKGKYNKRSKYSETETLFLSWENGSAPVGEVKKFSRFGKTRYYEKTESGSVELSKQQFIERNKVYAENIDRRAERRFGTTADYDETTQRGSSGDYISYRDTSGDAAVFGQTIREKLPDVSRGSESSTLRNGLRNTELNQSEYNEEASANEQDASFVTFSNDYATIRNFMKEGDVGEEADVNPIKYSMTKVDADYFDALEKGDDEKAQKMVDEAAKNAGYTIKAYHGTKDSFTVFKRGQDNQYDSGYLGSGFYFTDNKETAENYSDWKKGHGEKQTMNVALRMKNPLIIKDAKKPNLIAVQEALGLHLTDLDNFMARPNKQISDAITEEAKKQGYDGIVRYVDFLDETTYVVFDSNQVKSSDTLTIDDDGAVTPLSERFNTENNDIRYSLSDSDGKKLTKEQAEYFKDSKAVDRNGNLLKVYHTTKNDFTVFDDSRKGSNTYADNSYLGHFFTDNPDYMGEFPEFKDGKTEAYYLNMKKPIDMSNISKQAFLDIVEVTGGDVQEAAELYDREYDAEVQRAKFRGDNSTIMELPRLLEELTGEYYYDSDFHEVLRPNYDKLLAKGYDGIINNMDGAGWANEYIVINSNQAKLTTNTNPTEDADIRYSLSEDTWSQIHDMQMEVNRLTESIREFEASEGYKDQMRKISEAVDSGNVDAGVKEYQRWMKESGYEALTEKRNALRDELTALRKRAEESQATEALNKEKEAIEKSGLSEADYFRKQAVKEFGYTPYFYDAGYIVTNGKMLNFSGEKGQHFGSRGQDHRAIGAIYAETDGTDALNRFVNDGNIRISPESPGIDLSATTEPTKEQYATIRNFIYQYADKGYFSVDISDKNGRVIGSLEYENRIYPTKVIADLKHYYATGEIRQPSGLDSFRSLSAKGEQFTPSSNDIYGKDFRVKKPEQDIAPVAETTETAAPVAETTATTEELFPDDTAPIQEEYEFLIAEREDIKGAMDAYAAVGDYESAERLMPEYEEVQSRIEEIERDDAERFASIEEADAPPEMENSSPEDVADDVPLTKTLVTDLAKQIKAKLGIANNRTAEVRELIERYSKEEFPSKAHLYTEIAERFGKVTETQVDEELKGVKSLLRTYGISVDESIKKDIADYGKFMRSNFGKVRFSNEGLPVDVAYKEFQEALPGYFPESINVPTDQLLRIIEVANMDTTMQSEYEIDWQTLEEATDTIMNAVSEFKQNRKETLANKHGRESFESLMESADQYVPPVPKNIAPVKRKPVVQSDPQDIAPVFDTSNGQQAFMPEEEVPKKVTRGELHESIVDNIKTTFREKGFDFDEVLKKAKDLSTFATVDNTPQRVMEKALGYKQGQVLGDLTVNKVAQNETEGIRWLNSFTDKKSGLLAKISEQYKIKPGSKASAAAQMYAEGFYVGENDAIIAYGDKELAADFPDVKVQENIKKLARDPRIRQIYDETLAAINESRTRNAYPEIPRLDNYFLHFRAMEDTFSRLGLPFNPNDIRAKDLPTDLNGVTADLKPGQPYFASAKHRMGKRTSFDLLGGLEKYLSSAKNQIYHIDDIQTLRALRNYVAETYGQAHGLENIDTMSDEEAEQRINEVYNSHLSTFAKFLNEEANVLAGKTSLIDRGLEGVIGRRGITFLDSLNKQVGANMVGFNVSSSLTNFLAPVQAFAKSNKFDFVKAMAQTAYNKIGSIAGKGDSFAEDSPVMIRRKGADRFYRTPFEKVGDAGYVFMSAVDDISTELIARTKYNELTRKGMDSQQAHYETDKWVSRLMGDRSLGQQPQLYNSKMLGLVTKFQLEVRNQLDSQFYDTIQEAKVSTEDIENGLLRNAKKAAKITSTFVQLAVVQHLFGKAFESVAGYNPAFDIIGAIIKAFGWDDEEESEDTALDNIEQGFLELLGDMPYTSTLTGGRIPIESALPITELIKGEDRYGNEKSRWDTLKEVAPYYLMPGGYGQLKKTTQGLGMFDEDHPIAGSYTDSGNLRFPVEDTLGNRIQAGLFGQYSSENARDYFDNERSPLKEKQIQEFIDVGMSIQDYWKYREGLSKFDKLAEKADYINSLDLTTAQKNVLINNIADRKEDIDMSDYGNYGSFEEFDFAVKNPEKYSFLKENNVSYSQYKNFDDDTQDAYDWAFKNPEKFTLSKAVASDVATYRKYAKDLSEIKADTDSSGKTISGSRKAKVLDYINSMDADYGEKIILFKSLYEADDTYNYEIIEYLNSRADISYEEEVTILRELGFTVLSDGTVQW